MRQVSSNHYREISRVFATDCGRCCVCSHEAHVDLVIFTPTFSPFVLDYSRTTHDPWALCIGYATAVFRDNKGRVARVNLTDMRTNASPF